MNNTNDTKWSNRITEIYQHFMVKKRELQKFTDIAWFIEKCPKNNFKKLGEFEKKQNGRVVFLDE